MDKNHLNNMFSSQSLNHKDPLQDTCPNIISTIKGISIIQTQIYRLRLIVEYLTQLKEVVQPLYRYRPRHRCFDEQLEKIEGIVQDLNGHAHKQIKPDEVNKHHNKNCLIVISLPGGSYIHMPLQDYPITLDKENLRTREGIRALELTIEEQLELATTQQSYCKSQLSLLEKELIPPKKALELPGMEISLGSIQNMAREITLWTAEQILSCNDLSYTGEDCVKGQRVSILLSTQ